jgi:glycosyltransferase involved in cell wall biosynthesis
MTRVAAVLWSGLTGGAETFTADLCRTMRDLGAEASVLFVSGGEPLSSRLDADGIPYKSLRLGRGREVIRHSRALAKGAQALGPDGVLLMSGGYLAASLRMGGYRGRVVAIMHSATLGLGPLTLYDRLVRPIDRASGFWATDVDVAVSDFALSQVRRHPRRGRLIRIYNGVDLEVYKDGGPAAVTGDTLTLAYGGRLIEGKGVDVLLRAFAEGSAHGEFKLRIAGDGPARPTLERLAAELRVTDAVEFFGWAADMPAFWRGCDVAVMPSDKCIESFGMAAVEAMACERPVIATQNGALSELVADGITGFVVPPGDARVLAGLLDSLARDPDRRRALGKAGRVRCEERFDIRKSAASYLALFGQHNMG